MKYACTIYKENEAGLTNGYYVDRIIVWDGNRDTFIPPGVHHIQLPTNDDWVTTAHGEGLYAIIDGQLTGIDLPAIGDKYDPDTGTFTRPNSDIVLWGINTTLL